MGTYSSEELVRMKQVKHQIVDSCSTCGGTGFVLRDDLDYSCDCSKVFRYVRRLMLAGISSEYWTLTLKEMSISQVYKKILKTYVNNLESAISKSLGLFLIGENGIGKTTVLAEIGKQAIARGYSVQSVTQDRYMQWISSRGSRHEKELQRLDEAQVILFDEVGKGYIKQDSLYVPSKIEEFFRKKLAEGVAMNMCTNYELDHLEDLLGSSTLSVVERHLKIVQMEGADYSPVKQDSWLTELTNTIDYTHPAIVKLANRMDTCAL